MRVAVRIDRVTRQNEALRERLRVAAADQWSRDEPPLRGLPPSSALRRQVDRQAAFSFHEGERTP